MRVDGEHILIFGDVCGMVRGKSAYFHPGPRHFSREGAANTPASAAALAGLKKLVLHGDIDTEERAVCILTGHLLKDIEALRELYEPDEKGMRESLPPIPQLTLDHVRQALV